MVGARDCITGARDRITGAGDHVLRSRGPRDSRAALLADRRSRAEVLVDWRVSHFFAPLAGRP